MSAVSVNEVNGFTASVSNPSTTAELTLGTSITGLLEGNGGALTKAATTGSGAVVLEDAPHLKNPVIEGTISGNVSVDASYIKGTLPIEHGGTGATTAQGAKDKLGLGNVDNTSDKNKPISTATRAALDSIITHGTPDATPVLKGKIRLAGDLTGTAENPLVAKNAITADKISDGSITDRKVNASGISGDKIKGDIQGNAQNVNGIVGVEHGGTGVTKLEDLKEALGIDKIQNTADEDKAVSKAMADELAKKIDKTEKGKAEGVATLDGSGKIPSSQLPSLQLSSVDVVSNESEMLGLKNAVVGSITIRTDVNKSYVLGGGADPSNINDWKEILSPTTIPSVLSVNGQKGEVVLGKSDIGLEKVDNTSDLDKPISTATQTALTNLGNAKEDVANKSQDFDADQNSTIKYPSVKATKEYVDAKVQSAVIGAGGVGDADENTAGLIQLSGDLAGPNSKYSSPEISNDAITTVKIRDGNVTDAKLATGISGSKISGDIAGKAAGLTGVLDVAHGGTGTTNLDALKAALGLDAVDNTSDESKPISKATQDALDALKGDKVKDATTSSKGVIQLAGDLSGTAEAPKIRDGAIESKHIKDGSIKDADIESISGSKITGDISVNASNVTGTVAVANGGTGGTTPEQARKNLGLDKVSNVPDSEKPISNATQTALNDKEDKVNKVSSITSGTADSENKNYPSALAVKTYVDSQVQSSASLPPTGVADANKVLTINSAGQAVWQDAPSGSLPDIPMNTLLGNNLDSEGKPVALDPIAVKKILGLDLVKNVDQTNADNITGGKLAAGLFNDNTVPLSSLVANGTADGNTFLRGDGQWVTIDGVGGNPGGGPGDGDAFVLEPATNDKLGGVIVGGGLTVDGSGKIAAVTDLIYTAEPSRGIISSTTASQAAAIIPAGSITDASLMIPADKEKLDKLPKIETTDQNKVLTVNSAGTAAEWREPAPASGGGGGTLVTYHPGDDKRFFVRASGLGVTAILNNNDNKVKIVIPDGVILNYFKVTTSYDKIGKMNDLYFEIDDRNTSYIVNTGVDDLHMPGVNVVDINSVSPLIHTVNNMGQLDLVLYISAVSDGKLSFFVRGMSTHNQVNGFYVTLRF